jgi:hypothetical protein
MTVLVRPHSPRLHFGLVWGVGRGGRGRASLNTNRLSRGTRPQTHRSRPHRVLTRPLRVHNGQRHEATGQPLTRMETRPISRELFTDGISASRYCAAGGPAPPASWPMGQYDGYRNLPAHYPTARRGD